MGSFALLAVNIDHNIDELEHKNEILAYVDESVEGEDIVSIQKRLAALDNVSSAQFISREEAFANFTAQYPDDDFSDLDASVCANRYVIYLDDLISDGAHRGGDPRGGGDRRYLRLAGGQPRLYQCCATSSAPSPRC
jgi:cell division protein FtsX